MSQTDTEVCCEEALVHDFVHAFQCGRQRVDGVLLSVRIGVGAVVAKNYTCGGY